MGTSRPRVGLALSAGAFRGFCHLGVLQVLTAAGIPVDFIAGTSMGAVVGAFYAAGLDLDMLARVVEKLRLRHLVDPALPRRGLFLGNKITEIMHLFLKNITFDRLHPPLAVVATDLRQGKEVVLQEGKVVEAIRASMAVPGIFTPVHIEDRILVDGGLVNRVPVSVVRTMGAEIVIAVKISLPLTQKRLNTMPDILLQSFNIMQMQIMEYKLQDADVVIDPDVGQYSSSRLDCVSDCIAEGARAARRALPRIRSLLQV